MQRGSSLLPRARGRLLVLVGVVVAAAVAGIAVVAAAVSGGPGAPSVNTADPLVTGYLPGEFSKLPDACGVVAGGTLDALVPGRRATAAPQVAASDLSAIQSQCHWEAGGSAFRQLDLMLTAERPSPLVGGDGSATTVALTTMAEQRRQDSTGASGLTVDIQPVSDLGDQAYLARRHYLRSGQAFNSVSVVVRFRNTLIVVTYGGGRSGGSGSFTSLPMSSLQDGALRVAQEAFSSLH